MTVDGGSFASTCGITTVVCDGLRFETMVHDFKFFVRFFTFFDVSSISIDCPARCNFEVHIKRTL